MNASTRRLRGNFWPPSSSIGVSRNILRIHRRSTRKVESGRYRFSFSKSRDVPLTRTQTQDPFVRQGFAPACLLLQDTGYSTLGILLWKKIARERFNR